MNNDNNAAVTQEQTIMMLQERLGKLYLPVNKAGSEKRPLLFSAPGRVNLIGEHTDYNNCSVLPMAVNRGILAAAIPNDHGLVQVADLNPEYGAISFSLEEYVPDTSSGSDSDGVHRGLPPFETGHWGNYIKAGVNGLLGTGRDFSKGYSLVFSSTIPHAAGMSSSSALVVLSALVLMEINGFQVRSRKERLELAEICRRAEWYTGSMGGGMDQAAILMGRAGHACLIDFNPLRVREVPFPSGCTIIVTHSTVEAPKTRTAMDLYNRRSVECRIAASAIGKKLNDLYGTQKVRFIGDVNPGFTGLDTEQIESAVQDLFASDYYSYNADEAAELLGLDTGSFLREYCVRKDGTPFPVPDDGFKLRQRFMHVWQEWKRVYDSEKLLSLGNAAGFGELMNIAHESAAKFHEISCPELDILTGKAREAGAYGSRLTGAGFGGCAVNLVLDKDAQDFMDKIRRSYYVEYLGLSWEEAGRHIFPVQPAEGAGMIDLD